MSIRRKLTILALWALLTIMLVQAPVFFLVDNSVIKSVQESSDKMRMSAEAESQNEVLALGNTLVHTITQLEDSIDKAMTNAALTLQAYDMHSTITTQDLELLAKQTGMDDLYLGDMQGLFTVSTSPNSIGWSLFDIWDGYRMLVTGEATELPSTLKVEEETGTIAKFTAIPRYDKNGKITGVIESSMDASAVEVALREIVAQYSSILSLHMYEPGGLTLISCEKQGSMIASAQGDSVANADIQAAIASGETLFAGAQHSNAVYMVIERLGGPAYVMQLELDTEFYNASVNLMGDALGSLRSDMSTGQIVLGAAGMFCVALCALGYTLLVRRSILAPINRLQTISSQIVLGNLDVEIPTHRTDEIGALEKDFDRMAQSMREQEALLQKVAGGDYTHDIPLRSENDQINRALSNMVSGTNDLILHVRKAATQVSSGAAQIEQSSQLLASGASEQQASVVQLTGELTSMREHSDESTTAANQAQEVTLQVSQLMQVAMTSMQDMLAAMQSIDESSKSISSVIKVIEEIALQTNLLALNASIEAAHAGQFGAGFAVVAEEVRQLSIKSTAAAKETAVLIKGSTERVQEGNRLVEKTHSDLSSVGKYADESNALMGSVAQASASQSFAIEELDRVVREIEQVVQRNAASAQESAAASQYMSHQATQLNEMVGRFLLKDALPEDDSNAHRRIQQGEAPNLPHN